MHLADVREAADRIAGQVVRTPVIQLPELDALVGGTVLLKAEIYQRTGAFTSRGALNTFLSRPPQHRAGGVGAGSSGNHAQAVALLAAEAGIPAVLVMPRDAPQMKVAAVRQHGARVVFYHPGREDRDRVTAALAAELGASVLPSSDDPQVAAGHGTVALELLDQVGTIDQLVVPVGGGGLAAGCATVVAAVQPEASVIGVEPLEGNDTAQSLEAGYRVHIGVPVTLADGLRHQHPGRFTLDVNRRLLSGIATVSDEEIVAAMVFLWEHGRLIVEPSGACALAAVLSDPERWAGRRTAVILSGGNVDDAGFLRVTGHQVQRNPLSARHAGADEIVAGLPPQG